MILKNTNGSSNAKINNKSILKINIIVFVVIAIGFSITSVVRYNSIMDLVSSNFEDLSLMASEDIYHQINQLITDPVDVSVAMANNYLLVDLLENGTEAEIDEAVVRYLNGYFKHYNYDAFFLTTENNKKYYNYDGFNYYLDPALSKNDWYFNFRLSDNDCELLYNSGDDVYFWMRIIGYVYRDENDNTIRMFTYRQNIDKEKRKVSSLLSMAKQDPLTQVHNKLSTQVSIDKQLKTTPDKLYAFLSLTLTTSKL